MNAAPLPPLDLPSLLTIVGDAVSKEVVGALDGTGLRHGHGYVIQRLLVGPATATEMAGELGITQQAVSKAVKELTSLGHVETTPDPRDSRRRPVHLTARGRKAVATARAARRRIDARIREAIGDTALERLTDDLVALLPAFGIDDAVRRRAVPPPTSAL